MWDKQYNYRFSMRHKYSDYSLGVRLRITTGNLIAPFAHHDQMYYSDQLRSMLVSVFKFKDYEVSVELMEMLAFGKEKYKNLQLQELISYILERYVGEKGIMRYCKTKKYNYYQEKLMLRDEFVETTNLGLSFIEDRDIYSDNSEFVKLFDQIAKYPLQTITYKEYFQFLKDYLGSGSPMVVNPTEHLIELQSEEIIPEQLNSQINEHTTTQINTGRAVVLNDLHRSGMHQIGEFQSGVHLSGLQQLRDLLVSQIKYKCSQLDSDLDQNLSRQQTFAFFYQILLLERHSIEYILDKYFNFADRSTASFVQIVQVIGEVHFREILTTMIKQETNIDNANKILMDSLYFKRKVVEACFFFKNKPTIALLDQVFSELLAKSQVVDTNFISLQDFRAYILAFVCNRRLIFRQYSKRHILAANLPLSIAEVSNSNFEEDSEHSEMRPREFELSVNQQKLQDNYMDQMFDNQSKYSPNKITGLSMVNRDKSAITPFSQNRNPFEVSIKQMEPTDQQNKEVKTFIEYMLTPQKNNQPRQLFTSMERESLQREENMELKYEKVELKKELWNGLDRRFKKYTSNDEKLGRDEAAEFMRNELNFTSKFHGFDKKLLAFFNNRKDAPFQAFLSYTVHLLGEEGLFDFNKSQIKGKFTLKEQQLCQIIKSAYGELNNLSDEVCLVMAKKLIRQSGAPKFTYSHWLQVVKNKLSVQ